MDLERALRYLAKTGMPLVDLVYERINNRESRKAIGQDYGIPARRIGQIHRVGRDLFEGEGEQLANRQHCARIAREAQMSIDTLITMNKTVNRVNDNAAREPLRKELFEYAVGKSFEEVEAHAKLRLQEINERHPRTAHEQRWLRISGNPDTNGMRFMLARLSDSDAMALANALDQTARELQREDAGLSRQQAMADALVARVMGGQGASKSSVFREPVLLVPSDGCTYMGNGLLATSDGAIVPAREHMDSLLSEFGYATMWAPNLEGEMQHVDLWRTRRTANDKQRMMMVIDQLICADPECTHTAITSEAHHIKAWKNGGDTNVSNMVIACRPHHARNDDDREQAIYGHLTRDPVTGQACRQLVDEHRSRRYNQFPLAQYNGRNWVLNHELHTNNLFKLQEPPPP
ncbi:HNH endonuclease signature motif containing protein [Corynebacterium pseudopelargi]|uniref:HNH nuclease domain-containing protein n=1 Tax=Corynebacterium pseudopelargi TaxID=2080757 RepID=A0A3G6IT87_9CORY|nr:HNH endonuclease signature motif containing protein [Corynebacterium pseudopelargi]AZA08843.1 hypothetical protein CPPEL_03570 [Corynebacterium pseudopelargi]